MFRIPILLVLAGITSFMLYKNEKQRVPAGTTDDGEQGAPMFSRQPVPRAPIESDDDFSDSEASLSSLDLGRN